MSEDEMEEYCRPHDFVGVQQSPMKNTYSLSDDDDIGDFLKTPRPGSTSVAHLHAPNYAPPIQSTHSQPPSQPLNDNKHPDMRHQKDATGQNGVQISTKWGIFAYNPLLNAYFNFEEIKHIIDTETYLLSYGLYKLLPKMFPHSMPSNREGIVTTKWGLIKVMAPATMYIDLSVVQEAIDRDQGFVFGKGLFDLMPRIVNKKYLF